MEASPQGTSPWRAEGRLLLALLATLLWPVFAQEDLYGPSAPPDAAWVRAVNAEAPGGLGIRVGDGPLESVAFGAATGYQLVAPGPVSVDLGGHIMTVEVEPAEFLTVVAGRDEVLVITDTPLVDASRGMLALYNLTGFESLALWVVDGPVVIEGVLPDSQAAIAVTEAEVALEVRAGDDVIGSLDARLYGRGVAHAVMVVEGPDGPHVRYVAAVASE